MNRIKILGWVLLPFNILGLWYSVYSLQSEIHISYLLGIGLFAAQIIYIAKTLKVLEQFEITKKRLESVARETGLTMAKILKGEKER